MNKLLFIAYLVNISLQGMELNKDKDVLVNVTELRFFKGGENITIFHINEVSITRDIVNQHIFFATFLKKIKIDKCNGDYKELCSNLARLSNNKEAVIPYNKDFTTYQTYYVPALQSIQKIIDKY